MALPPTSGADQAAILGALQQLEAGGSTNGAAGIRLAYQLAQQHFVPGGVNRVILATDGDFNVGMASTEELIDLIQRQREAGIALTTLGFGSGNYNDHLLEQLANEGNGNHAYIDRLSEARKVLGEELSATLLTIAKDVKIQLEFNPAMVSEYRLIGYENRALNEEDFNNDRVDAGEIGAGHRVTALYEVSLAGDAQRLPPRRYQAADAGGQPTYQGAGIREESVVLETELAHLRIRYKQPQDATSTLIEQPILRHTVLANSAQASDDWRFAAAVAAFGQKLRGGEYLEAWSYPDIATLAGAARGADPFGYRGEFLQLVHLASALDSAKPVAQVQPGD
jgi:Ca-activated chloride channel family protein